MNNNEIKDLLSETIKFKITVDNFCKIEDVKALFEKVHYIGNSNCFLVANNRAYLPNQQAYMKQSGMASGTNIGGITGGVVGGIVGNAVANSLNETLEKTLNSIENDSIKLLMNTNDICGYIINKTENGFGFIPLTNNHKLLTKLEDVEAHIESFVSITNDNIKEITLTKIPLNFNRRVLKITFKSEKATPTLTLTIPTKSKQIEYQEENCKQLINMFK